MKQKLVDLSLQLNITAEQLEPYDEETLAAIGTQISQIRAAYDDLLYNWPLSPELAAMKRRWEDENGKTQA